MQQELALNAITHSTARIAPITLLVLVIGLRKAVDLDASLNGTFHLGVIIFGVCAVPWMAALFRPRMIISADFKRRLATSS